MTLSKISEEFLVECGAGLYDVVGGLKGAIRKSHNNAIQYVTTCCFSFALFLIFELVFLTEVEKAYLTGTRQFTRDQRRLY